MTIKFKKYLSVVLIAFLMLYNTLLPSVIFAEDVIDPTPTPTQSETEVNSDTQVNNDIDTTSNTGDNSINPTPTPSETITTDTQTQEITPTPTTTPETEQQIAPDETTAQETAPQENTEVNPTTTPTPGEADTSINNSADVTSNVSSVGNTGENTIEPATEDTACVVNPGDNPEISTGDAASVTNVENAVNTTSINSEVVYQTINLFVDTNGNINLSDPFTIASKVIPEHPNDSVINVNVTDVNNYAYVSNDIVSLANTGNNSINGAGGYGASAVIDTGDAYSLVSLLNKVNFTIINSTIHIVSINIFGNLSGNIVLPDMPSSSSTTCSDCGISLAIDNNATVENNVNSNAITGQNSITGLSGFISTGDAQSSVNILNLLATNFFGTSIGGLYINVLGSWTGNFIGWGGLTGTTGGSNLVLSQTGPPVEGGDTCSSCTGDINITNDATVLNNITSTANTGGNTINGGNGTITTGNAYSVVSLINLINTNFINSTGFFGFINIFGNWVGDIGGESEFAALEEDSENNEEEVLANSESNDTQEEGGLLTLTQKNNVGTHVLPGDTVTFEMKAKNTGTGKVYGAKIYLDLFYKGRNVGGRTFELGDIQANKAMKVSTGFVLSKKAPSGFYTARAEVVGDVGPDNHEISALADSNFNIFSNFATIGNIENTVPIEKNTVLGTSVDPSEKNSIARAATEMFYLSLLMLVIFTYTSIRLIRKRELVMAMLMSNSFKEKLQTLRMLLL